MNFSLQNTLNTSSSLVNSNNPAIDRPSNNEVDQWNSLLETIESQYVQYIPPRFENACLHKWKQLLIKSGLSQWNEPGTDNQILRPGTETIIAGLFKKYVAEGTSILELGSNRLNVEGESRLFTMIPKEYTTDFVYSDCYKKVVKKQKKISHRKYLLLNATKLSSQLLSQHEKTKDVIVSLNVLIVINREKFFQIAQEVYESLKPGGLFILLADNGAHHHPLMDCESDKIAIPWKTFPLTENMEQKITIGSRGAFVKNIHQAQLSMPKKLSDFFDRFLELALLQQRIFISKAYEAGRETLLLLFKSFLSEEDSVTVDIDESYAADAELALKNANFEILLNEQQKEEKLIFGRLKNKNNTIESKRGMIIEKRKENIPDDHLAVISSLNVILAQKKELL